MNLTLFRFLFSTGLVLVTFILSELFKVNFAIAASCLALLIAADNRLMFAIFTTGLNTLLTQKGDENVRNIK